MSCDRPPHEPTMGLFIPHKSLFIRRGKPIRNLYSGGVCNIIPSPGWRCCPHVACECCEPVGATREHSPWLLSLAASLSRRGRSCQEQPKRLRAEPSGQATAEALIRSQEAQLVQVDSSPRCRAVDTAAV